MVNRICRVVVGKATVWFAQTVTVLALKVPHLGRSLSPKNTLREIKLPFQILCSKTFISCHLGEQGWQNFPPFAELHKPHMEKPSFSLRVCCQVRDVLCFYRKPGYTAEGYLCVVKRQR